MHSYSMPCDVRKNMILLCAAVSALLAWILHLIGFYDLLDYWTEKNQILEAMNFLSLLPVTLTPFGLFGMLYYFIDKHLWKRLKVFVKIPDVTGLYEGTLKSSFDAEIDYSMKMTVVQTFTKISFRCEFEGSDSESTMASYLSENGNKIKFCFAYTNFADNFEWIAPEHSGMNTVIFDSESKTVKGRYFTNRETKGNFNLKKVD